VEHPVTELVTGLDLVHLQLRVASGEPLPFDQAGVSVRGHAVECRLYAEDPAHDFYPSLGRLLLVDEPRGPGLRVDSGFESGDEVTHHYDALLAKVIAAGATRAEAVARADAALARCVVLGVTTNAAFLRVVLQHPVFQAGTATTRFIPAHLSGWQPPAQPVPNEAWIAAALAEALITPSTGVPAGVLPAQSAAAEGDPYSPWHAADAFRPGA
jgi:acetyl/propionyl-CoA carboxylase alpha subunit